MRPPGGTPFQRELAMGAIGEDGVRVLNPELLRSAALDDSDVEAIERVERAGPFLSWGSGTGSPGNHSEHGPASRCTSRLLTSSSAPSSRSGDRGTRKAPAPSIPTEGRALASKVQSHHVEEPNSVSLTGRMPLQRPLRTVLPALCPGFVPDLPARSVRSRSGLEVFVWSRHFLPPSGSTLAIQLVQQQEPVVCSPRVPELP